MRKLIALAFILAAVTCFGQAITPTQVNPAYQTPNQWGGGQSWTALTPMYNDFISLNNIAVSTTGNNTLVGNNTFTGTVTIPGSIASLRAAVYSDSVGTKQALIASQSGLVVLMKFASGDTISLPASSGLAIGTVFQVKLVYSANSVGHCVVTNGSDIFYGTLFLESASAAAAFTSSSNKTIYCTSTTTGGLAGGDINFLYLGGGKWYVNGKLFGSGSLATPFKN